MTEYKIDKRIPPPQTPSLIKNKYPFGKMDIGDSFSVSGEELHQVRAAASWYGTRNNMKFSVRRYHDSYRCWRVA